MIKEAIDLLVGYGRQSKFPLQVNKDDPRAEHFMLEGGEPADFDKPIPPRNHCLSSLEDLIAMALADEGGSLAVFHDEEKVTLILDYDGHRVERAEFDLESADSWLTVTNRLKSGPWLDAKNLIRLLRTDLYGCLPDRELADIVRKVKIEAGQITTGETQRSRESIGREITSKVSTPIEIPERVTLMVPVYSSLGETDRYPLGCSVEVDPCRAEPFQLKPLPDEIERVQQLAVQSIGKRLKAGLPETCPCFYGSV